MSRFILGLSLLCLGLFALPRPAAAQSPIGPYYGGNKSCVLDVTPAAAWVHYTSADLKDQSSTANAAAACPSAQRFSSCTIVNTHATLKLWVVPASLSGDGASTTNRLLVGPGQSVTYPLYGLYPLDVSVRGEAGPSSGQIVCSSVPR